MKNIFNTIQMKKPSKNHFDLTHDVKMSGKMGNLYPVLNMECVPGDKFTLGCDSLIRFAPLLAPVMHRMDVSIHYFFVPNRILWDNWEKFITGDASAPVHPTFNIVSGMTAKQKAFADYFGIPPNSNPSVAHTVNALPFAAYQKIFNEYYRDQNLVAETDWHLNDGANPVGNFFKLQKRAFEHDYFTASLPFAQKGAAVSLPLGEVTLDVNWTGMPRYVEQGTGAHPLGNIDQIDFISAGNTGLRINPSVDKAAYDPDGSLQVGATTINDLRRAYKLQEWLEKNARAGTRYVESILAHFGVHSSDKRLQRPEYITGVKSPVIISEVLNTTGPSTFLSSTGDDAQTGSPQGDMAGHGVAITSGKSGTYYCEEHGFIIGILSMLPKTAYSQGIPKQFHKRDFLDYYFPSFAHLGEQEVLNSEIYAYTASDNNVFGYVPRYAEYKYIPSRIAGDFRTSLDYWHLGRKFASLPTLSQSFIECDPADFTRIFAVEDGSDNLWMHILHRISAVRPMPIFGTPSM